MCSLEPYTKRHLEYRHERAETERSRYDRNEERVAREQASLDKLDDLPAPDVLQQEIIEHLEATLLAFRDVAAALPKFPSEPAA